MRYPVPLLCLLAACGSPDYLQPTLPESPELVAVRGVVIDSLSREPVIGTYVAIEGKFYLTDAAGVFTAALPPGTNQVHIAARGFESFATEVTVRPSDQFEFQLRRLAPYPVACELYPDHFRAVIVDLQGRKTLERWRQSALTLEAPAGDRSISAILWGYRALDYYQWEVTIPDVDPRTDRVDWNLYDSEGHNFTGSCEPVPTLPDSLT